MNLLALIAPVRFIVEVLKPVLKFAHSFGFGWGMSIVMLTVVVRALMAPLTVKQFKSMQAMARVAPQLKALQSKYKDDKQRQQQEVMKFYQENKINPFASCLPLVLQLPFFLGLFYLLKSDLRFEICGQAARPCGSIPNPTGAEQFLFIPDLTDAATGGVLAVLIVLYVGSQLLSSVLMTVTADRNQRLLMYALPFVFVLFIIRFPAGLIVYWVTTNFWTVAQQYVLRRRLGPMRPPVLPGAEPAVGGSGGGGLLATLSGGAKNGKADEKPKVPAGVGARSGPPPRSPRKKKKRSGRRR